MILGDMGRRGCLLGWMHVSRAMDVILGNAGTAGMNLETENSWYVMMGGGRWNECFKGQEKHVRETASKIGSINVYSCNAIIYKIV